MSEQEEFIFSQFSGLKIQDRGVRSIFFSFLSPLSLALRWSPSCCVFMSSLVCAHASLGFLCVSKLSLLTSASVRWTRAHPNDPIFILSLRPLFQIQSYSEVLRFGASTYKFGTDTVQPIADEIYQNSPDHLISQVLLTSAAP